jgi:hypothetical protein
MRKEPSQKNATSGFSSHPADIPKGVDEARRKSLWRENPVVNSLGGGEFPVTGRR